MTTDSAQQPATSVLLAGGGSGGHIFPNLAILERLRERQSSIAATFVISHRPLDAAVMVKANEPALAIPVQPLTMKPWRWPGFYDAWQKSVKAVLATIAERRIRAVVATGGFVSGPAIAAARQAGIPAALVSLDAIPGKANRLMAGKANVIFTVYPTSIWPQAERIGMPLRRSAVGPNDKHRARRELGLDPQRELLLITGASQGASSLNSMMIQLVGQTQVRKTLRNAGWQILHLTGDKTQELEAAIAAYEAAQIPATVLPFCDAMGLAWAGASLAVSRAGAGSVAEAWANAVPTIFFPYPYHKDLHQKFNAEPLTQTGAGILMLDAIDPAVNARQLGPRLLSLVANDSQRYQMAENLRSTRPDDGAVVIADWVLAQC